MKRRNGTPIEPPPGRIHGALISDADAKRLSRQLAPLGEQWQDICAALDRVGYGAPAAAERNAIEALTDTNDGRSRLQAYWREWAKERMAGLVGPINILRGKYPALSAYRSPLIAALRDDVATGRLKSEGPIVSPQMEPTLKRYIETLSGTPIAQKIREDVEKARGMAASSMGLKELEGFESLDADSRYGLLIDRYRAILEPKGFTLDSHRKTGLVFRKLTSDRRWAFLFVDESRDRVDMGMLSPSFAITLPKRAVLPSAVSLGAVATFLPDDLVPRFRASCMFSRDSYGQFRLAIDSNAFLALDVYQRVDALLTLDGWQ